MNNATATAVGRFGQAALRVVTAAMVALFVLGMALETTEAAKSPASYQQAFVKACRDRGGTTKRVGSRVVQCTLPGGKTVTCDFNTNPPTCTKARTGPKGGAHGPIGGGDVGADPNGGNVDGGNTGGGVDGGTVDGGNTGGGVVDGGHAGDGSVAPPDAGVDAGGDSGAGAPTAGPLL